MKEFTVPLTDYLRTGLRSRKRNVREPIKRGSVRNKPGLVRAFNVQVGEDGLEPYRPITIPFTQEVLNAGSVEFDWPFPQLIKGKSKTFLAMKQGIYLVNPADYSLWALDTTFKAESKGDAGRMMVGNQWQLMDFHDTWALHNGITTIFHSGEATLRPVTDKIFTSDTVRVQAGCAFRGRSWMGGFDTDYFYQDDWKTFIDGLADDSSPNINTALTDLGENWMWWSTIGGGDAFTLFYSSTESERGYMTSDFSTDTSRVWIFDLMRRNEQGSMPMPWQGKVRVAKPLGKYVMVYGDGGVSALAPTDTRVGLIELQQLKQGISNTGAVGGNEHEQVFLDGSGVLWYIDGNLSVERLDFREHMEALLGTDVIISYSGRERRFYICNGSKAFTLTKEGGLTEHSQQITSVIESDGADLGMGTHEDAMSDAGEIITDTIDFQERGNKTLSFIEVASEIPKDTVGQDVRITAGCEYRHENRDDFTKSRLVPLNHFGQARIGVTAPDFRVRIKFDNFRDFNIDDLTVKIQMSDKRFTRGRRVTA